jgi:hypothetical protein
MNEQDLRDCFAMFALHGLLHDIKGIYEPSQMEKLTSLAYQTADAMLEARKPKEESGIVAVKRGRKKES